MKINYRKNYSYVLSSHLLEPAVAGGQNQDNVQAHLIFWFILTKLTRKTIAWTHFRRTHGEGKSDC